MLRLVAQVTPRLVQRVAVTDLVLAEPHAVNQVDLTLRGRCAISDVNDRCQQSGVNTQV